MLIWGLVPASAAVLDGARKTADCRADLVVDFVGSDGGARAWCKRPVEPGLLLEEVAIYSSWAVGERWRG